MRICILTLLTILPLGLYEEESSKGFEVYSQKHEYREIKNLFKQARKWQIVTDGETEQQTTQ